MLKVATLIWIMLGTTLAGMAVTAVLVVPQLSASPMRAIPIAALIGFAAAVPVSLLIARRILGPAA